MRHGTFRNKISKLLKNGKAVTDYYSSCALYTLPGHQFGKNVMTRNHPQIQIHNHPFYRFLTTMGKIIYELQSVIGTAVNDYWKLKALDSLRIQDELPEDQVAKLIYTLVENQGLRDIILKR
jgi:hypothetical protein